MPDRRFAINVNRLAIKSRFLYGLSGSDEVAELEERLQNCVVLENDRIESRLAAQELEASGVGTSAPGGAGNLSQIGLLIPRQSGLVVTLEQMYISSPGATQCRITREYRTAGSVDASNPIARDSRAGSSRVPACRIVFVNAAAAPVGTQWWVQSSGQVIDVGFVAAGSDTTDVVIWCDPVALNTAITAGFAWRERALESGFFS